jgi:hypothetical protein
MHYAMKAYGGVDVKIHIFFTSALAGSEWSASRPGRFTPGERAPCTHWIKGWVNPRTGLDNVEKKKFLTLPGLQPVACRYTQTIVSTENKMHKIIRQMDYIFIP